MTRDPQNPGAFISTVDPATLHAQGSRGMGIVLGIWGLLFLDLGFQLLMGRVADLFNGHHNALGVVLLQLMLQQFLGKRSDNLNLDPPNPTSFCLKPYSFLHALVVSFLCYCDSNIPCASFSNLI